MSIGGNGSGTAGLQDDTLSSPFVRKPTLRGTLVTLRPYIDSDLPDLASAIADPEVQRLTGTLHSSAPTTDQNVPSDDRLREWYATRSQQTDRLDLMIVDDTSNRCVGEAVLNEWDKENESCNFRIFIGPAGQNRGLGSEATRLILDYAFTHLPLHRIELEVYAFNPRAQRVYEKAGFVVEGRRRDALLFDGERVDAIVMSILKPEWELDTRPSD